VVVIDLEYTAWEGSQARAWAGADEHREVVMIGAVRLSPAAGLIETGTLDLLVRPRLNPRLSEYFVSLTGITQARVDAEGIPFPEALARFADFAGDDAGAFWSNGPDGDVLAENCRLHGIIPSVPLERFQNVRPFLASWLRKDEAEIDSHRLPELCGFSTPGRPHDALGDARAVAEALRLALTNAR
jgi:inhibitor of KinA sporulation pathway (predicted exonuclease)